jgi:hypothetical protein
MMSVLLCTLSIGCQGCNVATTPTPATPLSHQHQWGDYVIEYETMPGTDYSFHANFVDDANGKQAAVVDLTTDSNSQQLRFANSKVSLNGADIGPAQKGDRVKLATDGKVSVNGTERKP